MNIIPLPNLYRKKDGSFEINSTTTISYSGELEMSALLFIDYIYTMTNLKINAENDARIKFILNLELPDEGYIIDINETNIIVHAKTDQGAFYALKSIMQIVKINASNLTLDAIYIEDYPRFPFRSFMLDVARHFFNKDIVMRIIDYLAYYKFNTLHLHLSDDQGFRIVIDKYPLLTVVGSTRSKTKKLGGSFNNNPHSGFYTKGDIKEIVEYAKARHIEVIPEIDLPGHTSCIIASYPDFSCSGDEVPVETSFGIKRNVLCVSNLKVYEFVYDLLDEIIELFPSKYIHIGGDEVRFKNWRSCPSCKDYIKENNLKSYTNLERHFLNKISSYLREKSRIPIAWNDVINQKSNYNITLQHWTPYKKKGSIKEINEGRKAIISNFFFLYIDYPYAMTPLKKTYSFNPILKGITKPDNVLGVETPLWTEWISSNDRLEYHLFPRLAAVSEVAWTDEDNKDYQSFCNRLNYHFKLYDQNLINYNKDINNKDSKFKRIIKTINWLRGKNI